MKHYKQSVREKMDAIAASRSIMMNGHILDEEDLDTLHLFADGPLPTVHHLDDGGEDNDDPYRAIPVARWNRIARWKERP